LVQAALGSQRLIERVRNDHKRLPIIPASDDHPIEGTGVAGVSGCLLDPAFPLLLGGVGRAIQQVRPGMLAIPTLEFQAADLQERLTDRVDGGDVSGGAGGGRSAAIPSCGGASPAAGGSPKYIITVPCPPAR